MEVHTAVFVLLSTNQINRTSGKAPPDVPVTIRRPVVSLASLGVAPGAKQMRKTKTTAVLLSCCVCVRCGRCVCVYDVAPTILDATLGPSRGSSR